MPNIFTTKKRIVVKIGSALLIDPNLTIRKKWIESLVSDLVKLRNENKEIIIVSSGSIALGRSKLNFKHQQLQLPEKQAAAAVGQIELSQAYQSYFSAHEITTAQILLSITDSEIRSRYINAKNTLSTLLELNVIPIINENDTVATSEIRYGDNDRLAARIAQMVGADLLILLSDIDGLYTSNPNYDPNAKHIQNVNKITNQIESMAGESHTNFSCGGMITKIAAAKISTTSGCDMIICSGKENHAINVLLQGGKHTLFQANISLLTAKKRWLANHLNRKGAIIIDHGAEQALSKGKSLLAVGVLSIEGAFQKGDVIDIKNIDGKHIAVGMTNYSHIDADRIKQKSSDKILQILGYCSGQPILHRDNMVLSVS